MTTARKMKSTAPHNPIAHRGKEGLRERAAALREEADRLLSVANRKGEASPVESDSSRLSGPGRSSHRSKRKLIDADSSASAARREQLRSGDTMGRHEKFDTESSVDVGKDCGLSADTSDKANNASAIEVALRLRMDLAGKPLLDLVTLYGVYEHARNGLAMSSNCEFGRSSEIMVSEEGNRLGMVREAIYDELKRRNPATCYEAAMRGSCLARFAAECFEWEEVADIAAETQAWTHRLTAREAA